MKVLIGCDVDPVLPADPAVRPEGDIWKPLAQIQQLRRTLGDEMPPVTWLIRSDESVLDATGDFASGFTAQERMWSELLQDGHELGWHMHVLSRRAGGGLVLDPEPGWLAAAHAALSRHFPVRATRTGWDYGSNFLLAELDRLGVKLDFSALPGNRAWFRVGGDRLVVDWVSTRAEIYRPGRGDYRRPGSPALDLVEVPVTQFRNSTLGRVKRYVWRLRNGFLSLSGLGSKTRLMTDVWDELPAAESGVGTFYFHPTDLAGDGIRNFVDNVRRLRQRNHVEFVTASALRRAHDAGS